jgi:hypothetical protein
MVRSPGTFSGTQGVGTTTASSGTSHKISNNQAVDFGIAGSAWGSASYAVLYDALTAGNALLYADIDGGALVIATSTPVAFDASTLFITLGLTGGMSDYLSNKILDEVFRALAFTKPANLYGRLLTTAPSNAGGGTEATGTTYARVALPRSLTTWASTQAVGTFGIFSPSTGTGGGTSNNSVIEWPTPNSVWGTVTHLAINDASIAGNMWFWAPMTTPKMVSSNSPSPIIPAGQLTITFA